MKHLIMNLLLLVTVSCSYGLRYNGMSLEKGLTPGEEKAILDEHNRLRSLQAKGRIRGQPPAADMTRLEWSPAAAEHAQMWADNCGGPMHGNHKAFGEGQDYAGSTDRSQLFSGAFKGWFHEEYPLYTFGTPPGIAGHYTQIVTAFSTKIGCGANACRGHYYGRFVCNFFVGGNLYETNPFKVGPACSKCPKGYGYCKDSLCTSYRICAGDPSCQCKVDPGKCSQHGVFDSNTCQCRCNDGWNGLNCDELCEDPLNKMCLPRAREGECKPSNKNKYFVDMYMHCKAACGDCKAVCRNRKSECKNYKKWGNCESRREYMEIFCPKECNMC